MIEREGSQKEKPVTFEPRMTTGGEKKREARKTALKKRRREKIFRDLRP